MVRYFFKKINISKTKTEYSQRKWFNRKCISVVTLGTMKEVMCRKLDWSPNKRKNLYQVALLSTFYKGDHGRLIIQ